jgi:hypothetical protein
VGTSRQSEPAGALNVARPIRRVGFDDEISLQPERGTATLRLEHRAIRRHASTLCRSRQGIFFMTARKSTARKKAAPKKKSAARKKTAPKKKSAARKSRAKKSRSLGDRTVKAIEDNLKQLEKQLPKNLGSLVKDLRKGLKDLERQFERAQRDREARWNRFEKQVRKETQHLLARVGLAEAGSKGSRAKKTSSRRKK